MKPSDFQKTVQCRFESCLKKVVRSVVKDYYKELNRRKNKEISFSELPDVLVDKMAVWDDYETDYTIFSVSGLFLRVIYKGRFCNDTIKSLVWCISCKGEFS